jgi:CubicO group peptidase (beta-lactamase class C family)
MRVPPPAPFAPLAGLLRAWVADGRIPGAVVAVGRSTGPEFLHAVGYRALEPRREPMTTGTIFDLASLTKVLVTAPLAVELSVRGALALDQPLERHLPELRGTEAGAVPLHLLLTHTGGFPPFDRDSDYAGSKERLLRALARLPLESPPGARFVYSDTGFVLLQLVLERATGRRLDRAAASTLFGPLGFRDTRYGVRAADRPRTAPTERATGRWLRGRVHDPRARSRALAGVAGHAGVFGTAREVARFCGMILRRGIAGGPGATAGRRVLAEETVRLLTTNRCPMTARVRRGYGFDIESPYSSPRGALFSLDSCGHSGFTGVSLWLDPVRDGYVVLLTNSIHAGGHKDLKPLRFEAGTLAARGLASLARGTRRGRIRSVR